MGEEKWKHTRFPKKENEGLVPSLPYLLYYTV